MATDEERLKAPTGNAAMRLRAEKLGFRVPSVRQRRPVVRDFEQEREDLRRYMRAYTEGNLYDENQLLTLIRIQIDKVMG